MNQLHGSVQSIAKRVIKMVWLGDTRSTLLTSEREALLAERATIVSQIEALKKSPKQSNAAWADKFRNEDLGALAKKVVNIDKKLGRTK